MFTDIVKTLSPKERYTFVLAQHLLLAAERMSDDDHIELNRYEPDWFFTLTDEDYAFAAASKDWRLAYAHSEWQRYKEAEEEMDRGMCGPPRDYEPCEHELAGDECDGFC